ncbi:MAG: hypothetical protein EHM25_00340 [Nitrosopumilales archaeon]|nr:MAG: hypothetical protein EHM25_00340 [Nitrosopumilales archaeon]
MAKYFVSPSPSLFNGLSVCSCEHSIVIMSGDCQKHNKKWEARIDADYIQELIKRVEAVEDILGKLSVKGLSNICEMASRLEPILKEHQAKGTECTEQNTIT